MHEGPNYLKSIWPGSDLDKKALVKPLSVKQAALLNEILLIDAKNYYFSSLVTLASALHGINNRFYSWSIIKLYYMVFYILRGILALQGYCVYYRASAPSCIRAIEGSELEGPKKRKSTHQTVIDLYSEFNHRSSLLSQPIDQKNPLIWLQENREYYNYKVAKLVEPDSPPCLKLMLEFGVRQALSNYYNDDNYTYTFDPDHAMVAYPVFCLKEKAKLLKENKHLRGVIYNLMEGEDLDFLRSCFKDKKGPLPFMFELSDL